jgi:glucan phosphoethanolaminetransferase (alkaline phosphatase superfamily)
MFDEQRERSFYKGALVAPMVGSALLAILPSPISGVMAMSIWYAGLPYAMWAVLMFLWMRKQSLPRIRRAIVLAPVSCLLVCGVFYGAIAFARASSGNRTSSAVRSAGFFAPWILGVGYFWVLVILGALRVLKSADARTRPVANG